MSTPVYLYRYDLTGGMARAMSPMLIGRQIEGIWHTSIVVYGHEFYFDGGVGVVREASPGHTRFGPPYRQELLGNTSKTESEFMAWVMQQQRSGFGPYDYNLLQNNCNHFSQAASRFLLSQDIPADVKDMIPTLLDTPFGRMIRPTLEQATGAMAGGGVGGGSAPASSHAQEQQQPVPSATASASMGPGGVGAGLLNPQTLLTEDQEDNLILARTMLESNELLDDGRSAQGVQMTLTAVETLKSILTNIMDHPTEAKYRAFSIASRTYTEKLKPMEEFGVTEILETAGFVRQAVPTATTPQANKWVLTDQAASRHVLEAIVAALEDVTANVETLAAVALSASEADAEATAAGASPDKAKTRAAPSSSPPLPTTTNEEQVLGSPAATNSSSSTCRGDDELLRYCSPPFPSDFTPLAVGQEGGAPFFSIYVTATSMLSSLRNRDAEGCFGKCALSSDHGHLSAYYCSRDGKEKGISGGGYKVLCVRRGREDALAWVPASLLADAQYNPAGVDVASFVFQANGSRFGVARAAVGSGVHAGCREPSGRCVVPYGGRAENVTSTAEVLCVRARVPAELMERVHVLSVGDSLLSAMQEAEGVPFSTFDALLAWNSVLGSVLHTSKVSSAPVAPLRCRVQSGTANPAEERRGSTSLCSVSDMASASASSPTSPPGGASASGIRNQQQPRLLVCHDMAGGYLLSDRPTFFLRAAASAGEQPQPHRYEETVIDRAYTISYWKLLDVFVYFSHHRVTVPPRSWVEVAHRHGVRALGTIITEGSGGLADLRAMLTDAKVMGRIIQRLAELCEFFSFDGYLVNIENSVDAALAKRLVMFTDMLRSRVQSVRPQGQVIWYDAVTVNGDLQYQNALTAKNKPFFDVSDGLFTNYFWNPMHLALTRTAATNRPADVYVGVDVFGRNMFGGGRYNTHAATHEVVGRGLSVALFAPGWTCECEAHGRRDSFLKAECKLWSRLQMDFKQRRVACKLRPPTAKLSQQGTGGCLVEAKALWTAFATGVGTQFFLNGVKLGGAAAGGGGGGYCQPGVAHLLPPFQYEAQSEDEEAQKQQASTIGHASHGRPTGGWTVRLPLVGDGGRVHGGHAAAKWRTDVAWFGDQSLSITIPPSGAVVVADWCVTGLADACEGHSSTALAGHSHDVVVDIAVFAPSLPSLAALLGLRAHVFLQGGGSPGGGGGDAIRYKSKQLLSIGADAEEVQWEHPGNGQWHILRFNLSRAAARSHSSTGNSDGTTSPTTSSQQEYLAEVNAISLLNTSGSTSLHCVVGGLALHMVAAAPAASSSAGSPLLARQAAVPWPSFTLHPTSSASENVLELHKAGATVHRGRTEEAEEVAVALVATVTAPHGDEEATQHTVFLGLHRVVRDAPSVFLRLNTSRPVSQLHVDRVDYAFIENGY